MDMVPVQSVAQARAEADRLHRSGAMTLISLAAFWGIAAALFQWGAPLAGEIALLLGSIAAHPVAWLILKVAGGPAALPRSNGLAPLFYAICAVPVVVTIGAMGLADARADAFFAAALLGPAAAFLPSASLYGRPLYLAAAAVFTVLPVVAWFFAEGLLPWFGLIGVGLLLLFGAGLLRRLGGLGATAPAAEAGPVAEATETGPVAGQEEGGPVAGPSLPDAASSPARDAAAPEPLGTGAEDATPPPGVGQGEATPPWPGSTR